MICTLRRFIDDSRGVAALEYALLVGLITLGLYAGMQSSDVKKNVFTIFQNLGKDVAEAAQ